LFFRKTKFANFPVGWMLQKFIPKSRVPDHSKSSRRDSSNHSGCGPESLDRTSLQDATTSRFILWATVFPSTIMLWSIRMVRRFVPVCYEWRRPRRVCGRRRG
jgi:hypothetical protein